MHHHSLRGFPVTVEIRGLYITFRGKKRCRFKQSK